MKRRDLLKSILGFVTAIPFATLAKQQSGGPIIFGVDKALPGKGVTGTMIFDGQVWKDKK